MSEQDSTQSSTKQRRSRKTSFANQQNGKQTLIPQRPTTDDKEVWKAYWKAQGQHWRTEPEIDEERQKFLTERRAIVPDIEQGIYPFREIDLSRADVEWLLATHENGHGPINWNDESQQERQGLDLRGSILDRTNLSNLPLAKLQAGLSEWGDDNITDQSSIASFEFACLSSAHLEGANLRGVALRRCDLRGADLYGAHLENADLRSVFFDETSTLRQATLGGIKHKFAHVADVRWGGINLAVIAWPSVKQANILILGDEHEANQQKTKDGNVKDKDTRIYEYERAKRANRQLASELQEQGLNELATHFAYRAQMLQRTVFRLQGGRHSFGQYLFSLFLDLLAGYGYKPWRSFLAYLLVIIAFATAYFIIGRTVGPVLSPLGSFVFSMTSFHGRGFFPGGITLDDPLTVLAALEAFVGLVIEVTFIATLTQRLFGK